MEAAGVNAAPAPLRAIDQPQPVSRPIHQSERRAALLAGDAIAVTFAVVLALWTWSITAGFPFSFAFLRTHAVWLLAIPFWLIGLAPTREAATVLNARRSAFGIAKVAGILLLVYLAAYFWVGGDRLPRLVALYVLWNATLLVLGWRIAAQWSFTRVAFSRRILIAGSGKPLAIAMSLLDDPSFTDSKLVGVVTTDPIVSGAAIVGEPGDVDEIVQRLAVTDLVVALDANAGEIDERSIQRLLRCQESGTAVVRLAQLYEDRLRRVPVEHIAPSWFLTNFFDVARSRESSPLAKRVFDIVVASMLTIAGLVLAPIIAIAILAESGLPVLYRQERLGRGGRPFQLVKFRTMYQDAESDGKPRWSAPSDPRVTRVGRLLRRMRLDELPNILAVLRGEMSMVGPRPERPQFVAQLEREVPLYRARLCVAPGLTGWAQVNWPYGDSVRDAIVKLEYDLYYVKHQSIWFDSHIVLRTAGTILGLRGR